MFGISAVKIFLRFRVKFISQLRVILGFWRIIINLFVFVRLLRDLELRFFWFFHFQARHLLTLRFVIVVVFFFFFNNKLVF